MIATLAAMSESEVAVFLLVAMVATVVGLVISFRRKDGPSAAARSLALRLGGSYQDGGLFGEPQVTLTLGGRPAWIEYFRGDLNNFKASWTRVVVGVRGVSTGSLHILQEGFGQSFLKVFGAQDITVGDADFDARYVIRATPESLATRVFRPEQRHQVIASTQRLRRMTDPTIDLDTSTLIVQVREYVGNERDLMELVKTAEEFLAYVLVPTPPTGIEFVDVRVSAVGLCLVCGTALREAPVRCEACRTPHHRECWAYMGRCSTYGCRGRRAIS
jgi:hypothetical protein